MNTYTFINRTTDQEIEIRASNLSIAKIILDSRITSWGQWTLKP